MLWTFSLVFGNTNELYQFPVWWIPQFPYLSLHRGYSLRVEAWSKVLSWCPALWFRESRIVLYKCFVCTNIYKCFVCNFQPGWSVSQSRCESPCSQPGGPVSATLSLEAGSLLFTLFQALPGLVFPWNSGLTSWEQMKPSGLWVQDGQTLLTEKRFPNLIQTQPWTLRAWPYLTVSSCRSEEGWSVERRK